MLFRTERRSTRRTVQCGAAGAGLGVAGLPDAIGGHGQVPANRDCVRWVSCPLNEMAAEGWEYVRAETLPCDERKGLTGTQTTYQNILIFKRFKQVAQPLPLDARTTSRPLSVEPETPPAAPAAS